MGQKKGAIERGSRSIRRMNEVCGSGSFVLFKRSSKGLCHPLGLCQSLRAMAAPSEGGVPRRQPHRRQA